jgi:patatin-like phospholipase/acyl hydrolase
MRILSLDGGGIRGLISLRFLVEMEQATGQTIPELFDYFAGTSIGSIIAALFAYRKISAKKILAEVLTKSVMDRILPESFLDSIFDVVQCQPKYQDSQLVEVLEEMFGDTTLSETDKKVLITGFELEKNRPIFFKNYFSETADPGGDHRVRDACALSCSAPFYFPPHHLKTGSQSLWGIDGGLANNNPADCALIDALMLSPDKHVLLSIGTGHSLHSLDPQNSPNWGLFQWITKGDIVRSMIGGNVASSEYRSRSLAKILGHQYIRVDHDIPTENLKLDRTDDENLEELKEIGIDWWRRDGDSVIKILSKEQ